jgi:glutaredoxin-related protein
MFIKYIFFIITILKICTPAWAVIEIEQQLKRASEGAKSLTSPAVATLWGGNKRFKFFNNNKGELFDLKTSLYKSGSIKAYLRKTNSNELVVFMPGIFGSIQKGLTPQMIDQIEQTDVNLLVLNNMLSEEHIEAQPQYTNDPLLTEVLIHESALDKVIKVLDKKNLKVHIIAESLGSIIGSAWAKYDQDNNKRLTSLTLLWPPIDLSWAMKNFDKTVEDHREASQKCGIFKKAWLLFSELNLYDFPTKLTNENEKCLGSIVLIDGFMSKASKSWNSYVKVSGKKEKPPVSFEGFFRSYRKEIWNLIEKKDKSTKLETWIKNINGPLKDSITILTSHNDFLNTGIDLKEFKINANLKDDQLIIFPWGGHSGPMGLENFYRVIQFYSPAL